MFEVIAFYESIDGAGAWTELAAVADQTHRVNGDDIQIGPSNKIFAVAAMIEAAVAQQARLVSPSLRQYGLPRIAPLNAGTAAAVEPGSPPAIMDLRKCPLELVERDQLNFQHLSNPAAAQIQSALIFLCREVPQPVAGKILTARCTSATAAVAGAWTTVPLVWDEDLLPGKYALVGLKAISAGMLGARMLFPGQGERPGAVGCDLISDLDHPMFRFGELGVWGEFTDDAPPMVEVLSVSADAAQEFYLDLIKTA